MASVSSPGTLGQKSCRNPPSATSYTVHWAAPLLSCSSNSFFRGRRRSRWRFCTTRKTVSTLVPVNSPIVYMWRGRLIYNNIRSLGWGTVLTKVKVCYVSLFAVTLDQVVQLILEANCLAEHAWMVTWPTCTHDMEQSTSPCELPLKKNWVGSETVP